MWTPDVYEGAPTPVTAYFATAAKVAALCLFLRAILVPFPDAIAQWRQIIIFVSVLSMALGAVAAIGQKNIKRLMAYSSIGHMGYALLGLAAGTALGVRGVLIYLAIYVFTNIGVFACIQAMRRRQAGGKDRRPGGPGAHQSDAGAGLLHAVPEPGGPAAAGRLLRQILYLPGRDPGGAHWPAILGVLASAVGLVYYLRLVKIMYFDEPAPAFDSEIGVCSQPIMALSGAFALLFIFAASPLITIADAAAKALLP